MVYMKGVFVSSIVSLIITILISMADTGNAKIAYKKPIYNKSNLIKEKRYKIKQEPEKPSIAKISDSTDKNIGEFKITTESQIDDGSIVCVTTGASSTNNEQWNLEGYQLENEKKIFTNNNQSVISEILPVMEREISIESQQNVAEFLDGKDNNAYKTLLGITQQNIEITTNKPTTTYQQAISTTATTKTTESNLPVPCTCGIFLTSQLRLGQPVEKPIITNELDRTYSCNAIGQKQCQTKCLETIVQHLPNSASILCATLNRDCRKERAYLFIKNCRNHWINTTLTAGREYCCRDGQPYTCPLI